MRFLIGSLALIVSLIVGTSGGLAEEVGAAASTAKTQNPGPRDIMTSTINELVEVVEANPGADKAEKRRSEMRAVIAPRFNFTEMSKSALSRYWADLSEEQRTEFVGVFSNLLAKTYLDRVAEIERGMVEIKGERVRQPRAIVKTVVSYKEDVFPIDYKMVNSDGSWQVYDVVIENIGLVANYRNEFAGIIRREKFSGLIEQLKKKLNG